MKKLNLNKFLLLSFASMTCAIVLSQVFPWYLTIIVSLPLIILVPGTALYAHIFDKPRIGLRQILISSGLGILYITFETLILNFFLPIINRHHPPLTTFNIITTYFVVTSLILLLLKIRSKTLEISDIFISKLGEKLLRNLPLLLLPLLAIEGAIHLNDGGSGDLAIIATCLVVFVIFLQLIKNDLFSYSWLIFIIASTVLLSTSLRSSYVSGSDISQEFQVFQNTLLHRQWFISSGNPYNACLSLTILPVALHSLLHVSSAYIYKLVYQLIFALVPVIVFEIFKSYTKSKWSFLVAVFFIAQTQFILTMPAINRQEIALVYFSLMMLILLTTKLGRNNLTLLLIIGFGMITAHYSTTYVALTLLLLLYISGKVYSIHDKYFSKSLSKTKHKSLSPSVIIVLILGTLLWYGQVNLSSGNLGNVISQAIKNISSISNIDTRSESTQISILGHSDINYSKILDNYLSGQNLSNKSTIRLQSTTIITEPNTFLSQIVSIVRSFLLVFTKVGLVAGCFYLFFKSLKDDRMRTLALIGVSSLFIVAIVIVIPTLSLSYNLERVYQQLLIILSFMIIVSILQDLPVLTNKIKYIIASCIVILYFVLSPGSGLINQFTGGNPARINYSNSGDYYQTFYTHASDVNASIWSSKNCKYLPVFSDSYGALKIVANTTIPSQMINQNILNAQLNHCIVLDFTNNLDSIAYATYQNEDISYNIPNNYYSSSYALVYTNISDVAYIRTQ